jgi:GTPase SAR1 family protein
MEEIPIKSEPNEAHEVKIAVLGKSLVGKSALTYRFINDKFPTEHDTTIEDQYKINLNIDGVQCRLGIILSNSLLKRNFRYCWPR